VFVSETRPRIAAALLEPARQDAAPLKSEIATADTVTSIRGYLASLMGAEMSAVPLVAGNIKVPRQIAGVFGVRGKIGLRIQGPAYPQPKAIKQPITRSPQSDQPLLSTNGRFQL
jgi:hypothetical protein